MWGFKGDVFKTDAGFCQSTDRDLSTVIFEDFLRGAGHSCCYYFKSFWFFCPSTVPSWGSFLKCTHTKKRAMPRTLEFTQCRAHTQPRWNNHGVAGAVTHCIYHKNSPRCGSPPSQHLVNIQSTSSQHTVNTGSFLLFFHINNANF